MPKVFQGIMGHPLTWLIHEGELTEGLEVLGAGQGWVVVAEGEALDYIRARGAPVLPWNHGPVWYNGRPIAELGPTLEVSALADTPAGEQLWLLQLAWPVPLTSLSGLQVLASLRQDLVLVLANRDVLVDLIVSTGAWIAAVHDWGYSDAQATRLMVDGLVPGSPVVRPLIVRVTGPELWWEPSGHLVKEHGGVRWVRFAGNASDVGTLLESPFVLAIQAFEAPEASGCGCGCACGCGGTGTAGVAIVPRAGTVQATGIGDVERTMLPTIDATVIAFADSGCDKRHPDLEGRVIA